MVQFFGPAITFLAVFTSRQVDGMTRWCFSSSILNASRLSFASYHQSVTACTLHCTVHSVLMSLVSTYHCMVHSDILHSIDGREEACKGGKADYSQDVKARSWQHSAVSGRQDSTETRRVEAQLVWHQEILLYQCC